MFPFCVLRYYVIALGKWIKIQRENKKEADLKKAGMLPKRSKQRPCLSDERIEKLESVSPDSYVHRAFADVLCLKFAN